MSAKKNSILFYGVAAAILFAETVAVLSLGNGQPSGLATAIVIHISSILLAALAYYQTRNNNARFNLFLLPLTAIAGPFGAGLCLLASIIHAQRAPEAALPSDWIEALFDRKLDKETDRLHERISLGFDDFRAASYVEPFRDILSAGTVLQKQMVIAKIARYFRPAFAPLLLQAARSPNAAVRVQAATALAKIENDFTTRCIKLENTLKNIANDDPRKIELAQLYDTYAHAGLLDEMSLKALRVKAIAIYEDCLTAKDTPLWRMHLARLYLRQDQPQKTREWLEPVISSGTAPQGAMFWYMEALFRLRKFGDLRQFSVHNAEMIEKSGGFACIKETGNLLKAWQTPAHDEERDHAA